MLINRLAGAAGLMLLLTMGAVAQRALAQDAGAQREPVRVALVVGADAYRPSPLSGSVAGAKEMADALRNGGFDVVYAENAAKADMERSIEAFGRKLERGAFAVVYFSGYSARRLGRNFLAPVDIRFGPGSDAGREAIDIDALVDPLIVAKPSAAVIILDASRPSPWPQDGALGLAPPEPVQSVSFVYSAEPGKQAPDAPGGGVFAAELARAMSTVGLGFDAAFLQAKAAVQKATAGAQVPWQSPSLPKNLIVTTVAPVQSSVAGQPNDPIEIGFWDTIKSSETADDFQAYLDAYPSGRFSLLARNRLRQLAASGKAPRETPGAAGGGAMVPLQRPPLPGAGKGASAAEAAPAPAAASDAVRDCAQCPEMVLIRAGAFDMGSDEMFPFEGPVHKVTLKTDFYMGRREVTFDEWDACVADGGCAHKPNDRGQGRGERPVTNVDWNDAKSYVEWLSRRTGHAYRLPSESEWEYAARAGSAASYPWGKTAEKDKANCAGCTSQPVGKAIASGSYPANAFGLLDMMGNASEWVEDCWFDSYKGAPADGSAWTKPDCRERVLRGGSFNNDPRYLRSAARFKYDHDVRYYANGFRVVRQD